MIIFNRRTGYYECTNCGKEVLEEFNYCPECGTPKDVKTLKDYMNQGETKLAKAVRKELQEECKACQESGYKLMACPMCSGRMVMEFSRWLNDKIQRKENND